MAQANDGQAAASYDSLALNSGLSRSDAGALLREATSHSKEWLIAHGNETATDQEASYFDALASRCRAGEPLAYVLGYREFYGRRFAVNPDVLIPRADTECLVDWAINNAPRGARLLELGCGSGIIVITLACERPDLQLTATDISSAALQAASANANRHRCQAIRFLSGDWYDALPAGERFDLIVSNPPYVASNDPHLAQGDLRFEPAGALISGPQGLDDIGQISRQAGSFLAPGGQIMVEHGFDQADEVRALMTQAGLSNPVSHRDLSGHWRISGASSDNNQLK